MSMNFLHRQQRALRAQDGISVAVVLWTVMIAAALSVATARVATSSENDTQRSRGSEIALEAADAGINLVAYRLNQTKPPIGRCPNHNPDTGVVDNTVEAVDIGSESWCPVEAVNNGTESGGLARVRVSGGKLTTTGGQPLGEGCQHLQTRTIVSTGVANAASGTKVTRTVTAEVANVAGASVFPVCGLMADHVWLTDRTKAVSSVGVNQALWVARRAKVYGDMYYDAETKTWTSEELPFKKSIVIADPPNLYGNLYPSRHLNLDALTRAEPQLSDTVNGLVTQDDDAGVQQFGTQLNTDPCATTNNDYYDYTAATRELELKGGSAANDRCAAKLQLNITNNNRQFRFCRLRIADGARLVIPRIPDNDGDGQPDGPPVRIWIEDEYGTGNEGCPSVTQQERFQTVNEGIIVNPNGPEMLWIYGDGERLKADGSGPAANPYKMRIAGLYKDERQNTSPLPKSYYKQNMVLVAPRWEVKFGNYGAMYGAIAAQVIHMIDRSIFEYAEELGELIDDNGRTGTNYAFRSNSWKECSPVPATSSDFTDSTCQ